MRIEALNADRVKHWLTKTGKSIQSCPGADNLFHEEQARKADK